MRHKIGSQLWDFYAPIYDFITTAFLKTARINYIQEAIQISPPETEINNILIIGGGTGQEIHLIDQNIPITIIDYSKTMIKILVRKAKNHNNITIHRMNAQKLDFNNNTYHRIIMPLILAVCEDPIKALQEAERVLSPGGRLIVFDKFLHKNKNPSLIRKSLNVLTNLLATNINIDFHHLIQHTHLTIIKEIPAFWGGLFKIFILEKNQ